MQGFVKTCVSVEFIAGELRHARGKRVDADARVLVLGCVVLHFVNCLYIIVSFHFFANVSGATHR